MTRARTTEVAADLCDPRPEVRATALALLEELYVQCDDQVCTTDPEVAHAAVPHARRALGDDDAAVRIAGVHALALLAADAPEAVEDLARALADPVPAVRVAAIEALAEFGAYAAPCAPLVAERLVHGTEPDERAAAASALSNLECQASHADALVAALLGDVPLVQASAASAIAFGLDEEREAGTTQLSDALHRLSRPR